MAVAAPVPHNDSIGFAPISGDASLVSSGSYHSNFPQRVLCMSNLPDIVELFDKSIHSDSTTVSSQKHPSTGVLGNLTGEALQQLPGILEVRGRLGIGSFSHVYKCAVANCREEVAVKVLHDVSLPEIQREASLLKELKHPYLIRLIDYVQICNSHMLVLELCSGGSLMSLLHGSNANLAQRLGLWMRLNAVLGVMSAIDHLHSLNIVHRDVKSSNCFFADHVDAWAIELPPLKLGDLGLARPVAMEHMTRGSGTLRYMAPEVITSHNYGLAADVFSLGMMLHEVVTILPPFGSAKQNDGLIASRIVEGRRPPLDILSRSACDIGMPHLLESCWAAEPGSRPTTQEVLAQLSSAINQIPADAQ